eukprot:TRINITY_DN5705_c0_g1_i1.p1 TRINITY_DN5705_c0_g1~~TRINITY_DN5705_c0_g1_i1.p1  ORF type:complete len:164 (-),score=17.41 TRINITY_DN5705_c0_g1_i1:352-843(-)
MLGLPITRAMGRYSRLPFYAIWEYVKGRVNDLDNETLTEIVMAAFHASCEHGEAEYFHKIEDVIGETRANELIKAKESSIVADYLRKRMKFGKSHFKHAVFAGINLRLPEPIEKSAIWHIYTNSDSEAKQFIHERGLLAQDEIAAAERSSRTERRPLGFFRRK